MKKFFLALAFLGLNACNNNDDLQEKETSTINFEKIVNEKYDGNIFKFKDNKDFISFYNLLSNSKSNDYRFLKKIKGSNNSYLYESLFNQEEESANINTNNTVAQIEKKLNISEYLLIIFNNKNEININNKIVRINKNGLLISNNKTYGAVSNQLKTKENQENKYNVNYTKNWVYTSGGKRVTLSIFNETIYINNIVSSSNLFYKIHRQYESCSFWRCTWKDDNIGGFATPNLTFSNTCDWGTESDINQTTSFSNAILTKKIGYYDWTGACTPQPLFITGNVNFTSTSISKNFENVSYDYDVL